VALEAVRVGSFDIDAAIQAYVRREYGIAIGERTAEEIKLAIGSAFPTPEEVREAIEEQVRAICDAVIAALAQTPPELAHDLILHGIHLVGGGGMLRGLDLRIAQETKLPVHLVDAPLECVVLGAGRCVEIFDQVEDMFMQRPRG